MRVIHAKSFREEMEWTQ